MDHKERKGRKKTVYQVETNRYTNRNKTKETHPSSRSRSIKLSLFYLITLMQCITTDHIQPPPNQHPLRALMCYHFLPQGGTTTPQQSRSPTGLEKRLQLNHTCFGRAAEEDG